MGRKFCVGGNWKMNGTKESITELAKILSGPLDPNVEVVVGCPSVYISFARGLLPVSIGVAGQVNRKKMIVVQCISESYVVLRMPTKLSLVHLLVK